MAIIKSRYGQDILVDDEDLRRVSEKRWKIDRNGYAFSYCFNKKEAVVSMHRFILGLVVGDGKTVDHINRNKLDNRKSNLRLCTPAENAQNSDRVKNRTGFMGVTYAPQRSTNPYQAAIQVNGIRKKLGSYPTAELAHRAYLGAKVRYHNFNVIEWLPMGNGATATITTKFGNDFIVDAKDLEWLRQYEWRTSKKGYAETQMTVDGVSLFVPMHRIVCRMEHSDKRKVYHLNGKKEDNRRSNLEIRGKRL